MKHVLLLSGLFGLICVFAVGCGSPSPKNVATKFFAALEKGDTKAIGELATPETAAMLAAFGPKMQEAAKKHGKIKSATESIDGDTAVVTLEFASGETDTVNLVKVDGKWKISMDNSGGK